MAPSLCPPCLPLFPPATHLLTTIRRICLLWIRNGTVACRLFAHFTGGDAQRFLCQPPHAFLTNTHTRLHRHSRPFMSGLIRADTQGHSWSVKTEQPTNPSHFRFSSGAVCKSETLEGLDYAECSGPRRHFPGPTSTRRFYSYDLNDSLRRSLCFYRFFVKTHWISPNEAQYIPPLTGQTGALLWRLSKGRVVNSEKPASKLVLKYHPSLEACLQSHYPGTLD